MERYYALKEAPKILKVSVKTLQWNKTGKSKCFRAIEEKTEQKTSSTNWFPNYLSSSSKQSSSLKTWVNTTCITITRFST